MPGSSDRMPRIDRGRSDGMSSNETPPESVQRLRRIVVIDDDPGHLQVVKIIMMREDFPCDLILFQDPREALAALQQDPPDLVMMDVAMPGMDGFETFARMQANPTTRQIPVIFLSAYKETEYMLRAFEMGAADYLSKPISSPILTARIRAILHTQDLQTELRHRNEDLVHINRLKDEMLSICSHDLRSPLSAIDLICQFLKEALAGNSPHSKMALVNRIVNQSRLARRLVDNLLDLNRIEEGMLVPIPSFFRIRDLIGTCTEDEAPLMQGRQIELKARLPADDMLCFGDREMIAQVLRNILGNASKFARGSVTLDFVLKPAADGNAGSIALTVADDGAGIPAAEMAQLFGKYGKLDKSTMGSGLGLYISRNILEKHGGKISVQSTEGRGSTFTIELPNTFPASDLPSLEAYSTAPALVLSASKATSLLLESVLVEAGMLHVVKEFSYGPGAVLPELVVADAQNPALAEFQRMAEAAADPEARQPKWIVCGTEGEARALQQRIAGSAARLSYPINPVEYLRVVRLTLGFDQTEPRRDAQRRVAERSSG
jgi:signal transduction histidine kinase